MTASDGRRRRPSSEALQVVEKVLQLRSREVGRGHVVARLFVLRVENPPCELARRVGQYAGADEAAACEVGEVGADLPARIRAGDRVAVDAPRAEEHLLALLECRGWRRARRLTLGCEPRVESIARLSDDDERHVRVL